MAGLYAAVKYDDYSQERLDTLCKEFGIPNKVETTSYHSTVLFERDIKFKYQPAELSLFPGYATPIGFETWVNQNDGKTSLVLKLKSGLIDYRRKYLEAQGATWDFDEFKLHITLSYDVPPDLLDKLNLSVDLKKLGILKIVSEYSEPLNTDWNVQS